MSNHTNTFLINGNFIQDPATLDISYEDVWSSNSGRTKSGKWTGDLVAWKWRLDVTFAPVSATTMKTLLTAVARSTVSVTFVNPFTDTLQTISCYPGQIKPTPYNYKANGVEYTGLSLALVER